MIEIWDNFHFLRPWWLLLAPAILGLEYLLSRRGEIDTDFSGVIGPELLAHLQLQQSRYRLFTPSSVLAVVLLILAIVLAGPSWRQQPTPLAEDAAPVILVLDVSESMGSTDIEPSRIQRARQKMQDLLARISDKSIALMIYAGSAHTVLPLTRDADIALNFLHSIDTEMAPRSGKFPEYVLPGVDRLLADQAYRGSIVLVTDGLGENSPVRIGAWCQTSPHQLVVYGIGRETPMDDSPPLETGRLKDLASSCDGRYIGYEVDTADVDTIARVLNQSFLVLDDEALPWLDSGYPLLFPALGLALLWFRRGWTRVWIWLAVPMLLWQPLPSEAQLNDDGDPGAGSAAQAAAPPSSNESTLLQRALDGFIALWLTPDQYGRVLLSLGYYDKAARTFENPSWQATSHYYDESFRQAAVLFTRSDNLVSLFNEANAHAHRRDYLKAVRRYEQLLEREPHFPGARQNRDRVQTIIDQINRMSASQQQESGVGNEELKQGDPRPAEGASEMTMQAEERRQYSAEEILASPEATELWLKAVQQDPAEFLRTKFSVQLEERGVSE